MSSFEPEGYNSPEGEQRQEARRAKPAVETATGLKRGSGPVRGEPDQGCGAERPNGRKKPQARKRSSRPGTLTLGRSPREWESFEASERPLRADGPVQGVYAVCLDVLSQELEKTAAGERTGEAPDYPECVVQYRACRW